MNMSYCRFYNTLNDLHDCYRHMDEAESQSEQHSRNNLIRLCVDIAVAYGHEVGREVEESEYAKIADKSQKITFNVCCGPREV